MLSDIKLSELIAVKLCHDLSGPVGAINNGVELLKENNDVIYDQSVELVEASAKDAVSRILFYRQVYGTTGAKSEMSIKLLKELSDNFFLSKNITLQWPEDNKAANMKGEIGKLVLNLILFVANCLVYGGDILIGFHNKKGDSSLYLKGEGKAVKLNEDKSAILAGDDKHKITVQNVQVYLTSLLINSLGYKTNMTNGENFIELSVG